MKIMSQKATSVLDALSGDLKSPGDYKKIDNTNGFMAVCVENIGQINYNKLPVDLISVTHYFEQNGDLMRDPEMIFVRLVLKRGNIYYPIYFRQDPAFEQYSVDTKKWTYDPEMQKEHAEFAEMWMRNIKEQQKLSIK